MHRIVASLVFAVAIAAHAQDAAVIALAPEDARAAAELHREQEALNVKWAELRKRIVRNYLEAPNEQKAGCVYEHMLVRPEWGCGEFVFSASFKFIVPAPNLTKPPFDNEIFQLLNGTPTPIREKSDYEIERELGPDKWIYNNTPNSWTDWKPN